MSGPLILSLSKDALCALRYANGGQWKGAGDE